MTGLLLLMGLISGVVHAQVQDVEAQQPIEYTLSEIKLQIRDAYETTEAIELDVVYYANVDSFDSDPVAILPHIQLDYLATSKFFLKVKRGYDPTLRASETADTLSEL
jgi:hypothetical protein